MCKTFRLNFLHNSLKTHHTNIILTHFLFCKTHQSLAKRLKIISEITFRKSEYKDLSSKYFFPISNKSIHSIKISNCDYSITCNTNRSRLFFSQNKKGTWIDNSMKKFIREVQGELTGSFSVDAHKHEHTEKSIVCVGSLGRVNQLVHSWCQNGHRKVKSTCISVWGLGCVH